MTLPRVLLLAAVAACPTLTGCGHDAGPASPPRADTKPGAAPDADRAAGLPRLATGRCSLTGNHRESNDDAVAVSELPGATLCLTADGMGGTVGGRNLGQVACERAFAALVRELGENLPRGGTSEEIGRAVRRAVVAANEDVMAAATGTNMGTTVVLALWHHRDGLFVAGVGDSRAYLIRGGAIEQLTVDQSLAQALVEAKTITPEEARTHRFRN